MYKYLILLILIIIISCSGSKSNEYIELIEVNETLHGYTFIPESTIFRKVEKISINNDILIIQDNHADSIFSFYSIPEGDLLGKWGVVGDGPNQITSLNWNSLFSTPEGFGFIDKNVFKEIIVQKPFMVTEQFRTTLYSGFGPINGFVHINNENYIITYVNKMEDNFEHALIHPDEQISLAFGKLPKDDINFSHNLNRIIYYNKTGVYNRFNDKLYMFYFYHPKIKIYKPNGNLVKEINLNIENPNKNNSKASLLFFSNAIVTSKNIYVLLINTTNNTIRDNGQNFKPDMLIFDFDGNLLKRYKLDSPVLSFDVTEDNNSIFASTLLYSDESQKILKFDLPDW